MAGRHRRREPHSLARSLRSQLVALLDFFLKFARDHQGDADLAGLGIKGMGRIVKATGHAAGTSSARGIMRLKTGFAMNHMKVAHRCALSASQIEGANNPGIFGAWFDEMIQQVPVAIVMTAAALEANVNEIIGEFLDDHGRTLTVGRKKLLKDLARDKSGSALDKYRKVALLLFDKETGVNDETLKNAQLLFSLRNHLMHFRPTWSDDEIHKGQLVAALKKRIPIAPAYHGRVLFPYAFMTYGCAKWSVETVLTFAMDYSAQLGIVNTFALPGLNFSLP